MSSQIKNSTFLAPGGGATGWSPGTGWTFGGPGTGSGGGGLTPGRLAEMEPPAGLVGFLSMRSFTKQRVSRLSRVQPTQLGRESHRAQQRLMFIVLSTYDLEPMLWPPSAVSRSTSAQLLLAAAAAGWGSDAPAEASSASAEPSRIVEAPAGRRKAVRKTL